VTVCAVEPDKHDRLLAVDNDSVSTSFFTLREGLLLRRVFPLLPNEYFPSQQETQLSQRDRATLLVQVLSVAVKLYSKSLLKRPAIDE